MKLFTAIVALTGMSTATASLRGANGILPSEMKDLLNKLAAADSQPTTSTCVAAANQMCDVEGVRYPCPVNYGCNFINMNNKSRHAFADSAGHYCRPSLELDELVEEEPEHHNDDCDVLGKNDGGCVTHDVPGLHCKEGLSCVGYVEAAEPGASATLGRCTDSSSSGTTTRTADGQSRAVQCTTWVNAGHTCQTSADCHAPTGCEVTCQQISGNPNKVCWTRSSSEEEEEEEEEELVSSTTNTEPVLDWSNCQVTTETSHPGCKLDGSHKPCCRLADDGITYTTEGVQCQHVAKKFQTSETHGNAGENNGQCYLNIGQDLAAN